MINKLPVLASPTEIQNKINEIIDAINEANDPVWNNLLPHQQTMKKQAAEGKLDPFEIAKTYNVRFIGPEPYGLDSEVECVNCGAKSVSLLDRTYKNPDECESCQYISAFGGPRADL